MEHPKRKPVRDPLRGLPPRIVQAMVKARPAKEYASAPLKPLKRSLLIFENPDKQNNGARSGAPLWMPPWPFRALLIGPPGSGKRNAALNIIFSLDPYPTHIHIVHIDDETKEYKVLEDIGCPVTYYTPDDPPDFSSVDGGHDLVIIDEVGSKMLGPEAQKTFAYLLGYGSTHKSCSIICMYHNLTSIDPDHRRKFNFFCIFPHVDTAVLTTTAARIGVPLEEMKSLMTLCPKQTDFLTVDASKAPSDPYRFRKNLISPVNRVEPAARK